MLNTTVLISEDGLIGVGFIIGLDSLPLIFFIIPVARTMKDIDKWRFGYFGDHKVKMN